MKIIKKGVLPEKEKMRVCSKCGCEFVYNKRDVKYDQREDDYYVSCPTCHQYISVNVSEL